MKTGKWLGILLAGAIVLGGCAEAEVQETVTELKESALTAPQRTEVVRGDIQAAAYYDAQVGPKVEQLTFAEEGSFGTFFVQLGDTVQEGDLIAAPALETIEKAIENKQEEIDALTRRYEYERLSLECEAAIAAKEIENVNSILAALEESSPEYTQVRMQLGNYEEQRQGLELRLKQLRETYELQLPYYQGQLAQLCEERDGNYITAPFDGVIVALEEAEYGDHIDTGKYYAAVADTSVIYARCESVSITVLNSLEKIVFRKDGKDYEAVSVPMSHDYYMATKNNGEDAYSEFEISDPEGEIAYGDYGKLMLISETKEDVLLLPETAVQSSAGQYYVYKDVDGKHEPVNITIGSRDSIHVEVVEGLQEGDVVYVQE